MSTEEDCFYIAEKLNNAYADNDNSVKMIVLRFFLYM